MATRRFPTINGKNSNRQKEGIRYAPVLTPIALVIAVPIRKSYTRRKKAGNLYFLSPPFCDFQESQSAITENLKIILLYFYAHYVNVFFFVLLVINRF